MPQPKHISKLPVPARNKIVDDDIKAYFAKCDEKIGFVPNVLRAYTFKPERWRSFVKMYHALMDKQTSKLTPLEREMIAVVVSSANRCYYCLVAHGAAVRKMSGDPQLGEMLVMNYRVAELSKRHRAMLDFAWKVTETPYLIEDPDRAALRKAGFDDEDIFDIAEVAGFYNMSNRVAYATDMMPNPEYHKLDR